MSTSRPLFVGVDLSTQQLKLTAVAPPDSEGGPPTIAWTEAVSFDAELPQYGTRGGAVARGPCVHAPALMWIEALDLLLAKLQRAGFPFDTVRAVSGCGQQHGSVFWAKGAARMLGGLDPQRTLTSQLGGTAERGSALAVPMSPIWMDTSTSEQCRRLEACAGGAAALAEITGSAAHERFTGPQIAKIFETQPEAYARTERISLVSSFMASLFLGKIAPIDAADASGMNLLNVRTRTWDRRLLDACAPDLSRRLSDTEADVVPSDAVLGTISSYFVERFGFGADCLVVSFTGDNPATLCSLPLGPNDIMISLGTSDTLCFSTKEARPTPGGHIMRHPFVHDQFFGMLVFKNGSLARERVCSEHAGGSWTQFDRLVDGAATVAESQATNPPIGLFFFEPEITPAHPGGRVVRWQHGCYVDAFRPASLDCLVILESQMLAMRHHLEQALGCGADVQGSPTLRRVIVAGGAAANQRILQVMADVFDAPVLRLSTENVNGASFGRALVAWHAWTTQSRAVHGGDFGDVLETLETTASVAALPRTEPWRAERLRNQASQLALLYQQDAV
ncbi:hypothetical protein HK105_205125 [Polyrhizophydium stewartii]|uniref:Xylulose kinase n=1 Tax=Polyrhizophydium stewartii TaxID=2732419 RepID=A0ABR4N735_9FUNG